MSAILALARSRPFAFGMGYSLMKTAGCDLMVQKVVEKRENIDWKRNTAFASFGLFYLGGVQYLLYVPIFGRIFPNAANFASKSIPDKLKDVKGIRDLFSQVFLDQMVHHPLLYFPVFYTIKDFVTSDKPDPFRAVTEYSHNIKEDLVALWKVWIPSTFLNFAFMPMWARIPWVASTSLIWTCILSAMRGGSEVPEQNVFAGVDATTMELMTRTVIGAAPVLDATQKHLLVFMRGFDRPGIVSSLSKQIFEGGGSITTSKMMSLGQEFAVIMHVSCPPAKLDELKCGLCPSLTNAPKAASGSRLQTHLTRSGSGMDGHTAPDGVHVSVRVIDPSHIDAPPTPAFVGKVWLTGVDQPGLLYHLSQTLSDQGLSIEHLQTEQHMPNRTGGPQLFSTHCHVIGEAHPDMVALKRSLKELEGKLGVACSIETASVHK